MIRISMGSVSLFNSARRVASMTLAMIDAQLAEMMIVEAALPAGMMALPRLATTAKSLAILPESAASLAVNADQEADQTSKIRVLHQALNSIIIGEEADSVEAVVVVISVEEAEVAVTMVVIVVPDIAAAAPEDPALLPDVIITEDPEVAATTEGHEHTPLRVFRRT
jgi:hypothetical protein